MGPGVAMQLPVESECAQAVEFLRRNIAWNAETSNGK